MHHTTYYAPAHRLPHGLELSDLQVARFRECPVGVFHETLLAYAHHQVAPGHEALEREPPAWQIVTQDERKRVPAHMYTS
jgi:hypothetical protein